MVLNIFLKKPKVIFLIFVILSLGWGLLASNYPFLARASYILILNLWIIAIFSYSPRILRTFERGNNFERYASILIILFILAITLVLNSLFKNTSYLYPYEFSFFAMVVILSAPYFTFQVLRPMNFWVKKSIKFKREPKYRFSLFHFNIFVASSIFLVIEGLFSLVSLEAFIAAGIVFLIYHLLVFMTLVQIFWVSADPVAIWKDFESRFQKDEQTELPSDKILGYSIKKVNYDIQNSLKLTPSIKNLNYLFQLAIEDKIEPTVFWKELESMHNILIQNPFNMQNLYYSKILLQVSRRWGYHGQPVKKFILLIFPPLLKRYRLFALLPKYLQDIVYEMFEVFHLLGIEDPLWHDMIIFEINNRKYAQRNFPLLSKKMASSQWKLEWNYRLFFGEKGKLLAIDDLKTIEYPPINETPWEKDLNIAAIHLFSTFFGQNSRMPWGGSVQYPYEEYDWVRRGHRLENFSEENYKQILPPIPTKKYQKEEPFKVPKEYQKEYIDAILSGKTIHLPEKKQQKKKLDFKFFPILIVSLLPIPFLFITKLQMISLIFTVIGIGIVAFSIKDQRVQQTLKKEIPVTNEFDMQKETFQMNTTTFVVGFSWTLIGIAFILF